MLHGSVVKYDGFYADVAIICRTCLRLARLGICLFDADGLGIGLFEHDLGDSIRHLYMDRT